MVALTALAVVERDRPVPAWAWLVPVFMISKPGVLAVLPAMVVAAVLSPGRFRRVTAVSVLAGLVQVVQLAVSSASGNSLLQDSDQSALSKLFTAGKYTVGELGRMLTGPLTGWGTYPWMFLGIGLALLALAAAVLLHGRAAPLVPIGLSLVFFTMVVDAFTFSTAFGRDMALLSSAGFDRRFLVAVIGAFFVVAGLIATVLESPRVLRASRRFDPRGRLGLPGLARAGTVLGAAVFAVWFVASGWLDYSGAVNRPFGVPIADVSQWEAQAAQIGDLSQPVVCVPVDPFGWAYGRGCSVLVDDKVIPSWFGWAQVPSGEQVDLAVPRKVTAGRLASVGIMVQPAAGTSTVRGTVTLTSRDGEQTVLTGEADLPAGGGLVQFQGRPTPLVEDVTEVRVQFDQPVALAAQDPAEADTAIVLWLGQPAG
jgi:hypothetical protein